jgi:adenosylhomocysteine nucleosidase
MKILVTFALENEFAPWRKMRHFQRVCIEAWDQSYRAKVGSVDVDVVVTGAGRFAVQQSLQMAFDRQPEACIVSGLAGALKPEYRPGAILAARTVGDVAGTRLIRSEASLISRARECGARIVEKFLVADRVVSTAEEKKGLGASGDAVDMESVYILAAASHGEIPAVAIRAISDGVESDLPLDFDRTFNERGAVSLPKVLRQIVTRPRRIGGLIRLAHESERAAGALAAFLDVYVQRVTLGPLPEIAKAEALAL